MDTLAYRQHVMYKRQAPLIETTTKDYEPHIFGHKHHRNASSESEYSLSPSLYLLVFLFSTPSVQLSIKEMAQKSAQTNWKRMKYKLSENQ